MLRASAVTLTVTLAACSAAKPSGRPSVLLITIDTLRADRLGCYGDAKVRTPAIDAFARRATLFEKFELVGEGFNLTNATNPATFIANQTSALFGKPTQYAGDFKRGEQRLFQIAARIEF